MPTLTLIRGLPGSGKSTLARLLAGSNVATHHWEADMYFTRFGVYKYVKDEIQKAHEWCLRNTQIDLDAGYNVIVSNTFVQLWQMEPYLNLARNNGHVLNVIECKGQFGNIHNVPEGSMIRFRENWEDFPCQ